eukprot:scaffold154269_cov20-Prasinocladus_malaysianus.AAC.1
MRSLSALMVAFMFVTGYLTRKAHVVTKACTSKRRQSKAGLNTSSASRAENAARSPVVMCWTQLKQHFLQASKLSQKELRRAKTWLRDGTGIP